MKQWLLNFIFQSTLHVPSGKAAGPARHKHPPLADALLLLTFLDNMINFFLGFCAMVYT
jgi:hypothetical protein